MIKSLFVKNIKLQEIYVTYLSCEFDENNFWLIFIVFNNN